LFAAPKIPIPSKPTILLKSKDLPKASTLSIAKKTLSSSEVRVRNDSLFIDSLLNCLTDFFAHTASAAACDQFPNDRDRLDPKVLYQVIFLLIPVADELRSACIAGKYKRSFPETLVLIVVVPFQMSHSLGKLHLTWFSFVIHEFE